MSELGEVICLDEKEDIYSTMADEASTKDDVLQEKEIKLRPTSIYKLKWDRLEKLKKYLNDKFEPIELNWNRLDYGFDVQLFAIIKESKCNLVHVMKSFIRNKDDYVKTYTRETYILIAVNCDDNLKGAFAICTGAGYHKVRPYVDTTFAYSVSKKILDPKTVGQFKCRFLNGRTLCNDKLFHNDRKSSNLPTIANDSFFLAEGFQAQIKALFNSGLDFLSGLSSSIKVTRFSLKIMKFLSMGDMFCFMKELLHVHLSNEYTDAEEFEVLTYVKPVKSLDLRKRLDHHLEVKFLEESNVDRNGFSICHKDYEQWINCENVQLLEKTKNGKVKIKTWECRPDISDIVDALGEEHRDWSSLKIMYKSKGKWRSDKFLNCIHGHVIYETKYYFHIGKDWFKVEVEYIRRMNHVFFKVVKEKLLLEVDEGYLPLPWCSENRSNEQMNADHCITFCRGVLQKQLSKEQKTKIRDIFLTSAQTSNQGRSLHFQDDKETRESFPAGNNNDNADEKSKITLPDPDQVGENELPLSDNDDDTDSNDDDDGNSVLKRKRRSAYPREKRRKYDASAVRSLLSTIIGEFECELWLKSLTSIDEENYNKMYYMLLNQILERNPGSRLNIRLGVDPDNKFPTFLHGDKILVENVELFDILKITKDKLYLYHVKEGVGQKTRDAASQIRIAANLINKARETSQTLVILGKWYEQIMNYKAKDKTRLKLKKDLEKRKCSKEEFLDLFLEKKIVYVYAFLDDAKERKPFNELVSDEQCLLMKEDLYKELKVETQEGLKEKIDVVCESLKSNGILSEKDIGFSVDRKFLDLSKRKIFQIFEKVGFSDTQAHQVFHTLEEHFMPTVSVKSHIAKFELIRLAHDFNSSYPDFELKFCQIKKPLI